MAEPALEKRQQQLRHLLDLGLFALALGIFMLGGALIIAYDAIIPPESKVALKEGQVAPRDVLAPRSLQYESDVLTEAKRDTAAAAVRPVYDPPDPTVANAQGQLARQILDYIENIRYDDFALPEQKQADLAAITALHLDSTTIDALLSIDDDSTWRAVDAQIVRLLERVMNSEVSEENIQAKKDNLPNLISASYGETEVNVIKAIVGDLIQVNTFYNPLLTQQAQTQAAEDVPVEMRSYVRGQIIIREGEIATPAHIEALDRFRLLQVSQRKSARFFSGFLSMALVTAMLTLYVRRFNPTVYAEARFMILLGVLFLLFLAGARIVGSEGAVRPYFYPASALAFLVATLVGPQLAIVIVVSLATLVGFMEGNSLEFAVLIAFGGTLGLLSLGRFERLNAYFVAGMFSGIACAVVALIFGLAKDGSFDFFTVFSQIGGSLFNGALSAALALVGLYAITNLYNLPTSLKIVELQQPNHPLLQRLLREAPGTYQHSLQVANLAELGAQQVNANGALLRVAAMYHDMGKITYPHFFVENQADIINPHDVLGDPYQSAQIIIGHVIEGDRLARRHRLPTRIREFILEHHGTTQVQYFYREALKRAEQNGSQVDAADFSYPGPRPQSRETAILMLADGCESSVRARRPQSKLDIQEQVNYIFDQRLREGQLDDSGLTLNDLRVLRETFLTALQGMFHLRIAYPGAPGQQDVLAAGAVTHLLPELYSDCHKNVFGKFQPGYSFTGTEGDSKSSRAGRPN